MKKDPIKPIKPIDEEKYFVVKGNIKSESNFPVARLLVKAFDKDLRQESLLGQCLTDKDGFYIINYSKAAFCKNEKGSADILIKIFDPGFNENLIYQMSNPIFNVPREVTIDIIIPSGVYQRSSEFERIVNDIFPLLQGVAIKDIGQDKKNNDIVFLTKETNWVTEKLTRLISAEQYADATKLSTELFYGISYCINFNNLKSLYNLKLGEIDRALNKAVADNIIKAEKTIPEKKVKESIKNKMT
jgi:hypothetical protein